MSSSQSKHTAKMVVVPHNPRRVPLIVAGWLLSVMAAIAVAVTTTSFYSRARIQNLELQLQQSHQLQSAAESEVQELQQQVTNFRLSGEIDKQATEGIRQEVIGLQSHITELEAEISFYKGLMDPSSQSQGVGFGKFELTATADTNRFSYRLVVQQVAANHRLFNGDLVMVVAGREKGEPRSLALSTVSTQNTQNSIKLRFKYFQIVEGELLLPEGFVPERVEAEVNAGKQGVVSQQFDWQIQES